MIVELGEQVPLGGELPLQRGALFCREVIDGLGGALPAHVPRKPRIPMPERTLTLIGHWQR